MYPDVSHQGHHPSKGWQKESGTYLGKTHLQLRRGRRCFAVRPLPALEPCRTEQAAHNTQFSPLPSS